MALNMPLSASIFRRGGPKKELFDTADEQRLDEVEISDQLAEIQKVLAAPKTGHDFSAAIWRPNLKAAELVLVKKSTGHNIGFTWKKKHYLHVEEAVFLVDRADLLLFLEGANGQQRLLSLQEAYELMLCSGVNMERYIVYSNLARSGYLVMRSPSRWVLQPHETPDAVWGQAAWRDACTSSALGSEQAAGSVGGNKSAARQHAAGGPQQEDAGCSVASSSSPAHRLWWQPLEDAGQIGADGLPETTNLPRNDVAPHPGDSLRQRFAKLRPFGQVPSTAELGDTSPAGHLVFDIYKPGSRISRNKQQFPELSWHVAICSKAPPSPQDMQQVDMEALGRPVKWAAVEAGIITFYAISKVGLMQLL